MIAYFPELYPDELLYSQLARYYAKSSYLAYTFTAQDLFVSKSVRPDIEFINEYLPEALQLITRNISMGELVEKHTMFPYYGRFLKRDRRKKAFDSMISMQGNYFNLLPLPKKDKNCCRYLRYCPMCANEDRVNYGETYWHRIHQMLGLDICAIHKCKLVNSSVAISGNVSPTLISAEMEIKQDEKPEISNNKLESNIAEYMMMIFHADIEMDSDITVGQFLHSKLEYTNYLSVRGEQRNISLLHNDFIEYYSESDNINIMELRKLQKIFTDDRCNFYEICLLGFFLNIPVADMVHMRLPETSQQQKFDEQVYYLHEQGLNYPEIAKKMGASINIVKPLGEKRYGAIHKKPKNPLKSGSKAKDWQQIDKNTLPKVQDAIKQLQGDGICRPKRVTKNAVELLLGLPSGRFKYLPKCRKEIEKHVITQAEYWALEVVWAYKKIMREGQVMNWKHIRMLTNMRRKDLMTCMPYLQNIASIDTVQKIESLL